MHFTTQKQQLEAYRHIKKQERLSRCKQVFQILCNAVLIGAVMFAPALGVALGWIKD